VENWGGDPDELVGPEREICEDYTLAERLFVSKAEAFAKG